MSPRILLVDDDENVLAGLLRSLRNDTWELRTAVGGEEGLKVLEQEGPFWVVVSDYQMPRMNGAKFLAKVLEKSPDSTRILFTGESDFDLAINAVNEGNIFRLVAKGEGSSKLLVKGIEAGIRQFQLIINERTAKEREVKIAFEIQKTLLFGNPPARMKGCDIAALTLPSRGVDGDFIDFYDHSEFCVDVLIGDVMGKGIPAAMIGAGTKNRFSTVLSRLFAASRDGAIPEPEQILRKVQDDVGPQLEDLGSFVTICYARFDFKNFLLTYVDAGHSPTMFFSAARREFSYLKSMHSPLGFPKLGDYCQAKCPFEAGDLFMFFSDGLVDVANQTGEFFGMERIETAVKELMPARANDIIQGLLARVRVFSGNQSFSDDLSCVVVKVK